MAPVIHLVLRGRFGNHLFQFAAAYALGKKLDRDVVVHTGFLEWRQTGKKERVLKVLNQLNLGFSTETDLIFRAPNKLPAKILGIPFRAGETWITKTEELLRIDPKTAPEHIWLFGFFQSIQAFQEFEAFFKEQFRKSPLLADVSQIQPELIEIAASKNTIAIHVRGGDYRKLDHIYRQLHAAYYQSALERLGGISAEKTFLVFTDDPAFARDILENLLPKKQTIWISDIKLTDLQEFALLSRCKNFALSNSTFAWWSARLSEAEGTKIVVPERWFVKPEMDAEITRQILPENWILG